MRKWHNVADAASHRPQRDRAMSSHPPPSRPIYKTMGAAAGAILGLVTIAAALIVAAYNPGLSGKAIAVAGGVLGIICLAVAIVAVLLRRLRLPNDNDAWVFW